MKRRFYCMLLACALVLSLVACDTAEDMTNNNDEVVSETAKSTVSVESPTDFVEDSNADDVEISAGDTTNSEGSASPELTATPVPYEHSYVESVTKEANLYGLTFMDSNLKEPQYCMEDMDVYFEPSFQSEVIGHLSINEEVKEIAFSSGDSVNKSEQLYPPYDKTEQPNDLYWSRIVYNGQTGYIPTKYVWTAKRDTSVKLHPLYANYPTVDGGGSGSGIYIPYVKEWRYVYGSTMKLIKNPHVQKMEIYDGIDMNVIDVVTDSSVVFEYTGNTYVTLDDKRGKFSLCEIYYNDGLAYVSQVASWCYE